jgi:hypothetical protein
MKAMWIAAVLVWGTSRVLAQTPEGAPPPDAHQLTPQQHMANLAVLLDLSDTQKTQVQGVLDEERAKVKAMVDESRASGTRPSWQTMHSMHEQLEQETITKLTPVLSPAQLQKFKILLEERDSRAGPPPGGPHGDHHADHGPGSPPPQ